MNRRRNITAGVMLAAAVIMLCSCRKAEETETQETEKEMLTETFNTKEKKERDSSRMPYAVRTVLREDSVTDPEKGTGIYVRYTELIVEENAPDSLKEAAAECNRWAEDAARGKLSSFSAKESKDKDKALFEKYAWIAVVTRADSTAFSILRTEYSEGLPDMWKGPEISYRFSAKTCDTQSGEEIQLSELTGAGDSLNEKLREALKVQYGTDAFADVRPENYVFTADALGIRFFFSSDGISEEKRRELGDYSGYAVTVAFPYDTLSGERAKALMKVPESYIAQMDPETLYDLPHGKLSVMLTKEADGTVIRMIPDKGEESSLSIEYADAQSDYYIIRSKGAFYLFRERIGYQEGFFYDFARPDGGFGRFAYNTCQYFDSFLRELGLALPYDPDCVHMCEVRRSFGEKTYDSSSFVPNGHYSFPDDTGIKYQSFVLENGILQIDTGNTACRLLEDRVFTELDADGNETGEISLPAGSALRLEEARGEAKRYQAPARRNRETVYTYDCRTTDGRRVRLTSNTESVIAVNGEFMNRFTVPVSLAEAKTDTVPEAPETFTVRIGQKDYPVIPDYSKLNHVGEEIDFGGDLWWNAEGVAGRYEMTKEDAADMRQDTVLATRVPEGQVILEIGTDGAVQLDYDGRIYEGKLPEKRYYGTHVSMAVSSQSEYRSFEMILREGKMHEAPTRIEFYSEGLPATNKPSGVPPLSVYLTKTR